MCQAYMLRECLQAADKCHGTLRSPAPRALGSSFPGGSWIGYKAEHMTTSILITGGAGYIGSHTAVTLMEAGHHVVIADSFINSSPRVLDRLRRLCGNAFAFVEADVRDPVALDR